MPCVEDDFRQGWWLYGDDLSLAQQLQEQRIAECQDPEHRAYLIAQLTYLGAFDACQFWLSSTNALHYRDGRQAQCRLRLAQSQADGWSALAQGGHLESLQEMEDSLQNSSALIVIDLVGGIGDQLQMCSLVMWLNSSEFFENRLRLRPRGVNGTLVEHFLHASPFANLLDWQGKCVAGFITNAFFRMWLEERQDKLCYSSLINLDAASLSLESNLEFLCCWRTKPDRRNPLTSFSRSLPFRQVYQLLEQWQPVLKRSGMRLFDLSDYCADERQVLMARFPEVTLIRDQITSLADTAQWMGRCASVISVDTSLLHLAATAGRVTHALFPLFPDERWIELLAVPGVYRDYVIPHRQIRFHDWTEPLNSLSRRLGFV